MKTTLDNSRSGNPNTTAILKEVHVIVTYNDLSVAKHVFATDEYPMPINQARQYATKRLNDSEAIEVVFKKVYAKRGETVKLTPVRQG